MNTIQLTLSSLVGDLRLPTKNSDQHKHIVFFSGGKDSTAMLLMMIEKKMPIDYVLFANTDKCRPELYAHIAKVDAFLYQTRDMHITQVRLESDSIAHPVSPTKVDANGFFHSDGLASYRCHRCTCRFKSVLLHEAVRLLTGPAGSTVYIGIAADEKNRCMAHNYPLVTWDMTEADALQFCADRGFHFGGTYKSFTHASCWDCPFERPNSLRELREQQPDEWLKMLRYDHEEIQEWSAEAMGFYKDRWTYGKLEELFCQEEICGGSQ